MRGSTVVWIGVILIVINFFLVQRKQMTEIFNPPSGGSKSSGPTSAAALANSSAIGNPKSPSYDPGLRRFA
jgi:hypothetical protein